MLSAAELDERMATSWKESADTSIANIESVTEALSDGKLSIEANSDRPETWVTKRSGDMGYTFSPARGREVGCHGRNVL
jgi:hypothetical protein